MKDNERQPGRGDYFPKPKITINVKIGDTWYDAADLGADIVTPDVMRINGEWYFLDSRFRRATDLCSVESHTFKFRGIHEK